MKTQNQKLLEKIKENIDFASIDEWKEIQEDLEQAIIYGNISNKDIEDKAGSICNDIYRLKLAFNLMYSLIENYNLGQLDLS